MSADAQTKPANQPGAPAAKKRVITYPQLPPDSEVYAEAGYSDWGLSGNQTKFRQYATAPVGWFLRDLRYSPILKDPGANAFFMVKGLGGSDQDYMASTRANWGYGATQVKAYITQASFFTPSADPIGPSQRATDELRVHQLLSRSWSVNLQYRSDVEKKTDRIPNPGFNQTTEFWGANTTGKLGPGAATLYASNLHFIDHTGTLASSDTQTLGARYAFEPVPAVDLVADASHVKINQVGLQGVSMDLLSLSGDFELGPTTDAAMLLQRRQLFMPVILNAYVKDMNAGSFSLRQRIGDWRASVGLKLQYNDQVNGTQSYTDVPKWTTVNARFSGKILRVLKATVQGYVQVLDDPPSSTLDPTATLYWTNRNYLQGRLEGGTPDINGYFTYTWINERDRQQATTVTTNQFTVGGTWAIKPTVNLFAELHNEEWRGSSPQDPTLQSFLPNSNTAVVELNWNPSSRAYLSVNYTAFATYNDNPLLLPGGNTQGNFVTISGRYKFRSGYEIGLVAAPWMYHDSVSSAFNYNATVFMITGSARF
jgi:hypothetical protein